MSNKIDDKTIMVLLGLLEKNDGSLNATAKESGYDRKTIRKYRESHWDEYLAQKVTVDTKKRDAMIVFDAAIKANDDTLLTKVQITLDEALDEMRTKIQTHKVLPKDLNAFIANMTQYILAKKAVPGTASGYINDDLKARKALFIQNIFNMKNNA